MPRRISQQDPALAIEFFNSGFYTHRSQLFAPFKGIGVNVVQFHDPIIDGANMEDTDLYEWSRRPGFSIFCSESLPDSEIVNQYYSSRLLTGAVYPWVDTTARWATFSPTAITTISAKTTTTQGYPLTVGNITYFSDGSSADFYKWAPGSNGVNLSAWGLPAPTIASVSSHLGLNGVGLGFWQPRTSYGFFSSLLDVNGNIESVSQVSFPSGANGTPAAISTLPLGGSVSGSWILTSGVASFPIGPGYTPYLFLYDLGLNIPLGSTVTGIRVALYREQVSGLGRNWQLVDKSVKLVIGGSVAGTEHASATLWTPNVYQKVIYGGSSDLWGLTPTASQINAQGLSGFGVAFAVDAVSGSGIVDGADVAVTTSGMMAVVTVYYQPAVVPASPGISGENEPNWPTTIGSTTQDGSIIWTNYGPIQTWYPTTFYPTPVVVLDMNGNLQLGAITNNTIPLWNTGTTYAVGDIVTFGGSYWISVVGSNTAVAPNNIYTVATTTGSTTTTQPYWAEITSPITTGNILPVWNTTVGGTTTDGDYTWENIGPGTGLAFTNYEYVYSFRTVYGHLTTSSPFSNATGPILGPTNGSISSFSITSNVVTFDGNNNFNIGDTFTVVGLTTPVGMLLNGQTFVVTATTPSSSLPLTEVAVTSNVLTITAINNLVSGQTVTFSGVATATFLNGQTVTVLSSGLSNTQFEVNFTHANYGPTADEGTVSVNGNYSASFTHADVGSTEDSGQALPLISTVIGVGTASPLCNSVATITSVSVTANIVTITAANNFQPGLYVTIAGLTNATFLNGQQVQVIAVDQLVGTENTYFQIYFETPNYSLTAEPGGTATFNAVEIYRTSDGGGTYLFAGAVTNPGANTEWTFEDFVIDADLNVLLIAPLAHQNDPPPGAPGSSITTPIGTITSYWSGRIWMVVGNYVYFDAGPDCTNGIPEESWPPGNRFQFAGPVLGLEPSADGVALLVYLADRVAVIMGGPETISFYAKDALSNFGISNPNALFRDGSTIGQFTTQKQYFELLGAEKQEVGEHIADYLNANFSASKTYVTMHRNGLDVGVFLSNGVDRIVRYGSNISAWSVPAFPSFGAGALRSIETSVGVMSLMAASPTGGITSTTNPFNPSSGISVAPGIAWINPSNITMGIATDYATITFASVAASSAILRASSYIPAGFPSSAVIQGVQVMITGKQTDTSSDLMVTIKPTNGGVGAESHTFQFGSSNTTETFGSSTDLWNMPWGSPVTGGIGFDVTVAYTGSGTPTVSVSEVQIIITYQNPGNYLYARDVNSWGDAGQFGLNNGAPYSLCNVVIGSITMSQLGAPLFPLQHVVGYFDAVGTLNNGGPSRPDIWVLPNEINGSGINEPRFVYLPEIVQEPPIGQNHPSATLLALRWPVNMVNSYQMSQFVHHLQLKVQFEPENAPNTIKAIAFKELQDS